MTSPALPQGPPSDTFDGLLEPNRLIQVSSQVSGVVDSVAVERGDRVAAGQVLMQLKAGLERATVARARASLAFAIRRAERNDELFEKELISTHEKDQLETEAQIARLQLREAEERLAMRTIRSPIAGVVVSRMRSAGEFVGDGPVLSVAAIDPLNVEVIVPVAHFGSIHNGQQAEVHPEAPVGGRYRATVTIVDEVIDAASGTFGVRLELPNPGHRVPAGLKCTVRFLRE
jgi:RND family efflux transporter MFP subunit